MVAASDTGRKVPGTLRFSPDNGGELLVHGQLRGIFEEGTVTQKDGATTVTYTEEDLEQSAVYPQIYGDTGTAVTLLDCLMTRRQDGIFGAAAYEIVHVSQIFNGVWYDADAKPDADGLTVRMKHVAHWVMKTGLQFSLQWAEDGGSLSPEEPRITQQAFDLPNEDVTTAEGTQVSLRQRLSSAGDRVTSSSLKQDFLWRLTATRVMPVDELLDVAGRLQALVSIATDRTAELEEVTLWHPEAVREWSEGPQPVPIQLFAEWNARDRRMSAPPTDRADMLFTLPMLGGMQGVGNWLNVANRHSDALANVMSTRYSSSMFVGDRLLNCAAALEAFDRARTSYNGSPFKTRLQRNAACAGTPFGALVPDVATWAEKIRYHRDDVAHRFGRARDSIQIHTLGESLYWLFVMCMLRESAAPDAVFDHMEQHRSFRQLRRRLPAAIT